ncbi:type I-C CRISPR-associated protein Cas8c/Csd1 [Candidatus Riflebacteria bacterium]
MILQALCDYYQRKSSHDESSLAPPGFEEKAIPFIIILSPEGKFINLEDTRQKNGKKLVARTFLVPKSNTRSGARSYETTFPLWDHIGYVLNEPKASKPGADTKEIEKNIQMAQKQHGSFIKYVDRLAEKLPEDSGLRATKNFLALSEEKEIVKQHCLWPECIKINGCNLSFRIQGKSELVCQSQQLIQYFKELAVVPANDSLPGVCLVSGEKTSITRLHNKVSGVGQKPEAFASINLPSLCSYGKEQAFNFPVGESANFEYSTALNHLLRKDSPNKFRLAEIVAVCWSEKSCELERILPLLFSGAPKDNPDAHVDAMKSLFGSIHNGAYTASDGQQKFYILGLAPNVARIIVKFWQMGTVSQMSGRIAAFFDDLDIIGREHNGRPSLLRLLRSIVLKHEDKNIPPNVIAETTKTILAGLPLPHTLMQLCLRRIKAEQKVTYERAALIKACLNRNFRFLKKEKKELTMALDLTDERIGYRVGRLFATLEKTQQDANPGLNSTIKDQYYGAASSTPVTVFATLMKLNSHHLAKLDGGHRVNIDRLIGEIMGGIKKFPAHFSLEEQGLFAIGYYHQRQDFFTKKPKDQGDK